MRKKKAPARPTRRGNGVLVWKTPPRSQKEKMRRACLRANALSEAYAKALAERHMPVTGELPNETVEELKGLVSALTELRVTLSRSAAVMAAWNNQLAGLFLPGGRGDMLYDLLGAYKSAQERAELKKTRARRARGHGR